MAFHQISGQRAFVHSSPATSDIFKSRDLKSNRGREQLGWSELGRMPWAVEAQITGHVGVCTQPSKCRLANRFAMNHLVRTGPFGIRMHAEDQTFDICCAVICGKDIRGSRAGFLILDSASSPWLVIEFQLHSKKKTSVEHTAYMSWR